MSFTEDRSHLKEVLVYSALPWPHTDKWDLST